MLGGREFRRQLAAAANVLFFTLASCQEPGTCTKPTVSTTTAFESLGKVQIKAASNFQTDAIDTLIPRGTELTAVVDHDCRPQARGPLHISKEFSQEKGVRSHRWVTAYDMTSDGLNQLASEDECLVGLSRPMLFHTLATDPSLSQQGHLQTINAVKGWDSFFGAHGINRDVVIAIIDVGVDLNHEDLKNNIWTNTKEIASNSIDDDKNGYIDDVHGYDFPDKNANAGPLGGEYHATHVAGLAAAELGNTTGGAGVMGHHVKIMSLNVFGNQGGAFNEDIDNAIRYAADNGADVINMSLGGSGTSPSTESALSYAISKGVTVLAAAGNEGRELTDSFFETPASYGAKFKGMITIGSIDVKSEKRSSFSNFSSSYVELAAPGATDSADDANGGVYSTMPNNKYGRLSGTSMATPVAAGAAALAVGLLKSRGVVVTPAMIEDLLTASSRDLSVLHGVFKAGVVDVVNLYGVIDKMYPDDGSVVATPVPQPTASPDPDATPGPTAEPAPLPTPEPTPCSTGNSTSGQSTMT